MNLLHTETFRLETCRGSQIPPYAILSHTWGPCQTEVTFQDIQQKPLSELRDREGYQKIHDCCAQALLDGYGWVWVDTCNIGKSSSAELSEAINSMFRWYREAKICYVYLADVEDPEDCVVYLPTVDELQAAIKDSKWFTRGWTVSISHVPIVALEVHIRRLIRGAQLQELIAPKDVVFYSRHWTQIGTKASLSAVISRITRIDEDVLTRGDLSLVSVATKMSWAATRITTRPEDVAYCLLGIFDVNMPLLYGEGDKAFIRLQEEIMKDSDDQSLFVWEWIPKAVSVAELGHPLLRGLLASSPASFANSANIVPFRNAKTSEPYTLTNKGIRLQLIILDTIALPISHRPPLLNVQAEAIGVLECRTPGHFQGPIGIPLVRLTNDGDQFARKWTGNPRLIPLDMVVQKTPTTIFIRKSNIIMPDLFFHDQFVVRIHPNCDYQVARAYPEASWVQGGSVLEVKRQGLGIFVFERSLHAHFVVILQALNSGVRCIVAWDRLSLETALRPHYGAYSFLRSKCATHTTPGPLRCGTETENMTRVANQSHLVPYLVDAKVKCRSDEVWGRQLYIVDVSHELHYI